MLAGLVIVKGRAQWTVNPPYYVTWSYLYYYKTLSECSWFGRIKLRKQRRKIKRDWMKDNKCEAETETTHSKQVTAAERNNIYLDKDVARDRDSDSEKGRKIKRDASGCQVDQNKQWVPCHQRARCSQTDTKLDPPLSSSKQQTLTRHQVWTFACLFWRECFLSPFPFFSGLWF